MYEYMANGSLKDHLHCMFPFLLFTFAKLLHGSGTLLCVFIFLLYLNSIFIVMVKNSLLCMHICNCFHLTKDKFFLDDRL